MLEAFIRWVDRRCLEPNALEELLPRLLPLFDELPHFREPGEPLDEFLERWMARLEDV